VLLRQRPRLLTGRAVPSGTQQPFSCLTLPALFPAPAAARPSQSSGDGPGAPFHRALNRSIMPRRPEPSSSPRTPPPSRCAAGRGTRRS